MIPHRRELLDGRRQLRELFRLRLNRAVKTLYCRRLLLQLLLGWSLVAFGGRLERVAASMMPGIFPMNSKGL
jgi:hypothetical protein